MRDARLRRTVAVLALAGVLLASCAYPQQNLTKYVWEKPAISVPDSAATAKSPTRQSRYGDGALRQELARAVTELLDAGELAPLYVQLGIAGHEFFFDDSAETLHALSVAYPHLSHDLQARVKQHLGALLVAHPPWTPQTYYELGKGTRRELFIVPERFTQGDNRGYDKPPLLANLYPVWEYGNATGDWTWLDAAWPGILQAYQQFRQSNWTLDPARGYLYMNRTIAGLIGFARLARQRGAAEADEAAQTAALQLGLLVAHFMTDATRVERPAIANVQALDTFIGRGNAVWFRIRGHKHKIAKFLDMTPEVGRVLHDQALAEAGVFMKFVDDLLPGWYLANEETQYHYGENFIEYPDLSLGIFQAKALIFRTDAGTLQRYLDIPWCVGDLYYIEKLSLTLNAMGETNWSQGASS